MKRSMGWVLLALAMLATPAGASTFMALYPEEMVEQSEAVVQGRVIEVASFWNAEHTAILTEAVLEVEDAIVGAAPQYVNLRTFGGRVGNYVVEAHGFPRFQTGERLVVFLEPEQNGAHKVLGYLQGQFRVVEQGGRLMAVPAIEHGVRYLTPDGRPAPRTAPVALDELKNQIRETAGRVGRPAAR